MKRISSIVISFLLVLLPINALDIDLNISVENPAPSLWISDYTIYPTDRDGYAMTGFPGETIKWHYLARSLNGREKITDIYYEVNGVLTGNCHSDSISGYVDFAHTDFNSATDRYGTCEFTVRDTDYGDSTIETFVEDINNNEASASFHIFLNPKITLSADPISLNVAGLAGQTILKTTTIHLDVEGGASAKVYIFGTDFYDSRSAPTKCPTTNQFSLANILYKVSSNNFKAIPYKTTTTNPYNSNSLVGIFNDDFTLTFQINIPSPCIGNFDEGNLIIEGQIV